MITGILLAAGASSRFGSDKLLARWIDGSPIAVTAARTLKQVLPQGIAVVRSDDTALAQMLTAESFKVVVCEKASLGLGYSLAAGVSASAESSSWLIALADMPAVQASTIQQLVHLLEQGAMITAPLYQGQRGHPVGFAACLRDELINLSGDRGARRILQRYQRHLVSFESNDPGVVFDIDSDEDLSSA